MNYGKAGVIGFKTEESNDKKYVNMIVNISTCDNHTHQQNDACDSPHTSFSLRKRLTE